MSIKVEYYGYLKDIFGSIDIINYSSLKEKSIYNLLKNIKASKNILLDNNQIPENLIILKNDLNINEEDIYKEILNDNDILKIYFAMSGG